MKRNFQKFSIKFQFPEG